MVDNFTHSNFTHQELRNIFFPPHPVTCRSCQKPRLKKRLNINDFSPNHRNMVCIPGRPHGTVHNNDQNNAPNNAQNNVPNNAQNNAPNNIIIPNNNAQNFAFNAVPNVDLNVDLNVNPNFAPNVADPNVALNIAPNVDPNVSLNVVPSSILNVAPNVDLNAVSNNVHNIDINAVPNAFQRENADPSNIANNEPNYISRFEFFLHLNKIQESIQELGRKFEKLENRMDRFEKGRNNEYKEEE